MYKKDFLKFRRLREFLILIVDHLWYYIDNLMLNFEFHICSWINYILANSVVRLIKNVSLLFLMNLST